MLWMNRYDKHADLVNRMAETLGVDLAEEMLKGNLPPQDIRSTVMACMGCREPGACAEWLEAHPEGSDAAPSYCCNKDRLEALASF
jgi:pyrroloquinoline quinone (PQQ) biosynthesis protein C